MKLSDKIEHVINSFPCPVTYDPMRKDGLPKKDMFEWMCARIVYLEEKIADGKSVGYKSIERIYNNPVTIETSND